MLLAADCPVPRHPVRRQEHDEATLAPTVQEAGQVVRVLLIREVAVVTTPGVTSTRRVASPETGH